MSSRRDPPAGPSHSRPPSPFPRRPSVSTHQPPPSTPQFGRDPPLLCNPPPARSTDPSRVAEREFPRDAPKGPKALCHQPSSASGPGGGSGGGGGSAAHSPHKSSFSASAGSPHHGGHGHGHHYQQPGANSASRGSQPPPGPRGGAGRGGPLLPPANQIRSPVSTPGGAGISTSGGQMFAPGYPTAGETSLYRAGRRRSGEWEPGRGSGRSREREYDYGPRGGGGFGGNLRDTGRDIDRSRGFGEPRGGGYRGRSRDREVFPRRARSTSRERGHERTSFYSSVGGGRDRLERGGMSFPGDRRPIDRDERDPERERERRLRGERERRERDTERERLQRERERERERDHDRERFSGGDRRISMSIERERERAVDRPRVDAREGGYDPSRGDRERERRERDAQEYNRSREAERARFSSATQSHQVPTLTSPPPGPPYHGSYQLANASGSASAFGSTAQPPGRPPFQHPPAVGTSQWSTPATRRAMSGGTAGTLPQTTYRDRDKDPHRDVSQKIDYRLDTRSSDRAPLKKEPTDDISPLTQDSKSANTPLSALPSTGATPISATSSRPYSPPPAQAPSGPRSGTGANPPTGPRGGPPPTGPRHGVDRKDAERKWGSKDRGGSADYWSMQTPTQGHQTSLSKQSAQPPVGRLEIGSNLHPDRKREIEKVNDDRDNKHYVPQASIPSEFPTSQESAESSGTAEPAGTEHGSMRATPAIPSTRTSSATPNVAPLVPSRSGSSGQGFRGPLTSPNAPTFGSSGAGPLTPTAPAGPSGSPTGGPPPTAPRAVLNSGVRFRSRRGVGGYRPQGVFGGPALKRESDVGYWGAGRGIMGGVDGMGRGSMDRGRRGSRSGPEPDRLAAKEGLGDVEMLDARSKDGRREDIATSLEQSSQTQENAESHTEKTSQSPPPPAPVPAVLQPPLVVKIEDEEDEDDVSLTEADVISKIADIDDDIQGLEQKLEKLDRARMYHQEELERIEEEELQARNAVPPVEEVSAAAEFPEPEKMDLDLLEETTEEEQLQTQVQQEQQERQERQERAENGEPPSESLNSEPKPVEEDILDLPDRPRTPTASPSSTPSPMRSRTPSDAGSIETESDESIKHLMIPAHPGLPFYRPGPPLKPTDYGFFHSNTQQHEGIRELVVAQISAQKQATFERETDLKRKYCEYYEPWSERCRELDKESSRKKKSNSEPADTNGASPAVTASTAAETPTTVGRRAARTGDVVRSEAELEQVIKNLAEQDEQKADSGSKPPGVKEAYVPAMILDPSDRLIFQDTNRLLQSDDEIKSAFLYDVPPDDWTELEQKLFCDRYMQFPKQWGKIAQGIQGRDFKACILHYYMTKKAHGYKELQKGGGKRGRGKRRKAAGPQKTRQSALIADLGRRGGDEEDADSEDVMPTAMTDSGRPKRAAAPVFGGESNNNSNNSSSQDPEAPGKRGGKGDDDESRTGGTKRTRGNNNVGRERGQKRARAPVPPAIQPTPPPNVPVSQPALAPVPDKVGGKEKEKREDLGDRETDAVPVLAGLSGAAEQSSTPPPTVLQPVQPILTPSIVTEDKKPIAIPTTPAIPYAAPSDGLVGISIPPSPQLLPSPVEPSLTHVAVKKEKIDRGGGGGGVEKPVAQTSSYWSVPEQNDFPQLLAAYGTNWAAIAARLASKTTVMVRNFYQRQVDNGKLEFKQIAEDAERKIRAGEPTPEPPKPAALPKKRYESQIGAPQRMLVPQDPPQTLPTNQLPLLPQPMLLPSTQSVRPVTSAEDDVAPIKQQPPCSPPPRPVLVPPPQHHSHEIRQQHQVPRVHNPASQPQRQQQQQQEQREQREQQLREQQLREQQLREQQLREQQLREQQLREQQLRERQLRERQLREQREQEQHQQPQRPQQQHPHQQHPQQHLQQQHHLQPSQPLQPQPPPALVVVPSHSHPRAPPPSPQPPPQVQQLQVHRNFIQQSEEIHSGRPERRLEKQSERSHDRTHSAQLQRQLGRQIETSVERPTDRHSERQGGGLGKHSERSHGGGSQAGPCEVAKQLGGVCERQRDVPPDRPHGVGMPERQAVGGQPPGGSSIGRSHGAPQERMQDRPEKSSQDRSLERSREGLRTSHERHMNREIQSVHSLQASSSSPHTLVSSTSAQSKIIPPQVPIPKQQAHTQQIHHPPPSHQQQQLQQQGRGSYNQQHQPNQPLHHHRNLSSPSAMPTFDLQYSQQQQPFTQQPRASPAEKPQPSRAPEPLAPSSRPMSAPSSGQPINTPYKSPQPSHLSSTLQLQRQPSFPPQAAVHAPPPAQPHPSAAPAPSKPRGVTSIHSLLNPAKEEPPSRPRSRPTPPHLPPPQQPPPQHAPPPQHPSSQPAATQHVAQHSAAQHPPQHLHHSSLQHLQHPHHPQHAPHHHSQHHQPQQHSQSPSIHAPTPREFSRRDVTQHALLHESHHPPSSVKSAPSRGGQLQYDSAQPPRGPSSYSTPPREPYIPPREPPYTPGLREPPHTQSRQGLSGPHTPAPHSTLQPPSYAQGHHNHYSSRPQTCSPYQPSGPPSGPQSGPYAPPSSVPPPHPPHHSHYGQPPPPQQHPENCHTPPSHGYPHGRYYDGHDPGRQY